MRICLRLTLIERVPFVKCNSILDELTNLNYAQTIELNKRINDIESSAALWIGAGTLFGFIIAIGLGIFISKLIGKPIKEASKVISELSCGSLRLRMNWNSKDELGNMAGKLNLFIDTLQEFVNSLYNTSEGNFEFDRKVKDDRNEIAPALEKITATLRDMKKETDLLVKAAIDGRTDYVGNAEKFNGGYRTIVQGFNTTIKTIIGVVRQGTASLRCNFRR